MRRAVGRSLSQDQLTALIRAVPARKRLLILDTCEAGDALGGKAGERSADAQKRALAELEGQLIDAEQGFDHLGLSVALSQALYDQQRGDSAAFRWAPDGGGAQAWRLGGSYTVDGEQVTLSLTLARPTPEGGWEVKGRARWAAPMTGRDALAVCAARFVEAGMGGAPVDSVGTCPELTSAARDLP